MVAAPLESTDVMLGHLGWLAIRLTMAGAAYLIVAACPRRAGVTLRDPGLARRGAHRLGLRRAADRVRRVAGDRRALRRWSCASSSCRCSCSRAPSSRSRQLPTWMQAVAWVSPLWHGVVLCRSATTGSLPPGGALRAVGAPVHPVRLHRRRDPMGHAHLRREVGVMSASTTTVDERPARASRMDALAAGRVGAVRRSVWSSATSWRGRASGSSSCRSCSNRSSFSCRSASAWASSWATSLARAAHRCPTAPSSPPVCWRRRPCSARSSTRPSPSS